MRKCLALSLYLLLLVSVANAGTLVKGDLRISDGGDLVFSDGSVQGTAQVRGPAGPQGPPGQVTLAAICDAIKAADVTLPSFCPESVPTTPGSLSINASATGSVISATATYSNPTQTSLLGVPISFSLRIGGLTQPLGTFNTNNSGSVGIAFSPPPFSGTQTITVIARTGTLTNSASLVVTGRSLSVNAPANLSLTTGAAPGASIPFTIPPVSSFVTITDPFTNALSGHPISISATVVSSNPSGTVSVPTVTTTGSGGVAPFPGATGTLVVPATVGGVGAMTITWTLTDTITGLTSNAITTVTLTKV